MEAWWADDTMESVTRQRVAISPRKVTDSLAALSVLGMAMTDNRQPSVSSHCFIAATHYLGCNKETFVRAE